MDDNDDIGQRRPDLCMLAWHDKDEPPRLDEGSLAEEWRDVLMANGE